MDKVASTSMEDATGDLSVPNNTQSDETLNHDSRAPDIEAEAPAEDSIQSWVDSPKYPKNWSLTRKYAIIILIGTTNIVSAMCATAFEPAIGVIMQDFHSTSDAVSSLTVTIYVLGYVLGPLVLAPISELYGRMAVLAPAYAMFLIALAVCGISTALSEFLVFRVILGFAMIGFSIVGPGIVADIMPEDQRGLAISILSSGFAVRYTDPFSTIKFGTFTIAAIFIMDETYERVLLERRRAIQQHSHHRFSFSGLLTPSKSTRAAFAAAFQRPFKIFFQSPMVPLFAIFTSLLNSYINILFATLGTVYEAQYSFTPGQSGLAYLGLTVGFVLTLYVIGPYSDRRVAALSAQHDGNSKPEWRLPPLVLGSLLLPLGFLWYGWALEQRTPWIVPILGTVVAAIGTMLSYLPVQYYLVDCFTVYAASATGAVSVIRSICTALVPLAANPLYDRLGYGWGNTLLAFIALPFVGFAVFLLMCGERVRTHPRWQLKI
ncbi:hypothetical protein MMC11_007967 [Xylographa trunciseda]|nr:hypothetical protein [Xylographa trunciseda]